MKKVKVLLLFCFMFFIVGLSVAHARKSYYVGLSGGVQSQRYEFKIRDNPNNRTHNVDATRLAPVAGVFGGWRMRFPSKFVLGLEGGATFFPSEIKRKINNSTTTYKVGSNFFGAEGSILFGYFLIQMNTLLYLKLGGEYRKITVEVTSQGNGANLKEAKSGFGFFPALGVEIPLMNQWFLAAEAKFAFYQQMKFKSKDATSSLVATVTPRFETFNMRLIYQMGPR